MNNRVLILSTVFALAFIFLQFASNEGEIGFFYSQLQKSKLNDGKYKRNNNFWMGRETEEPLKGLVYDYSENSIRIKFGLLVN